MSRRPGAILALLGGAVAIALASEIFVTDFPNGVIVVVCVLAALAAFVDEGERYVDLGEVNGRVFVNNVSPGVYAEAVGQEQYRESKLRTLLETLAETLGPEGEPNELRWTDHEGNGRSSTALILVSNNVYLLGPTLGSGTCPRLDAGALAVVDFFPPIAGKRSESARWRELTLEELAVRGHPQGASERPRRAGADRHRALNPSWPFQNQRTIMVVM